MAVQFISAKEVPAIIKDGATIGLEGFLGSNVAEEVCDELEKAFLATGAPKQLTIVHAAGIGDGDYRGMNHFAHKGMTKRVVAGHYGLAPKLQPLIANNEIEAYNFPQGVISQMFREGAGRKKVLLSRVGLETYVDPRVSGGKLNDVSKEDLVEQIEWTGEEFLAYKVPQLDYAILRGTYADEKGNIGFDEEALTLESTSLAMACHNQGGKVIVQVKQLVRNGSLKPMDIKIPGLIVDYVVVVEDQTKHMMTYASQFRSDFLQANVIPDESAVAMPLNERKIIARRCAFFIPEDAHVVNYGIGMPEGISSVLKEEGVNEKYVTTIEPGSFGGVPMGGLDFGVAIAPECVVDQTYMFDFYDGGGIDIAFLGLAECDQHGNINVSKFGPKVAGCGGFINITQNTDIVIYCGTFKAGGLKIAVKDGKLEIVQEGRSSKFVDDVEHITFSGSRALKLKQKVYYVTERAVFKLTEEGVELLEIAPGIDMEKDVLAHMSFRPIIKDVKEMNPVIFQEAKMNVL